LKILGSTVLTFGLIFVFENLHPRRSKTTMWLHKVLSHHSPLYF
jgi:hypothetical protein